MTNWLGRKPHIPDSSRTIASFDTFVFGILIGSVRRGSSEYNVAGNKECDSDSTENGVDGKHSEGLEGRVQVSDCMNTVFLLYPLLIPFHYLYYWVVTNFSQLNLNSKMPSPNRGVGVVSYYRDTHRMEISSVHFSSRFLDIEWIL